MPLVLDLVLWLGPHFTIKSRIEQGIQILNQIVEQQDSIPADAVFATQETWQYFAEHFNLLGLMRTLPLGIPSLMASRAPIETPFGTPLFLELTELAGILFFTLLVVLVGLAVGMIYFLLVAQVSTTNQLDLRSILQQWPMATLRSVGLLLLLITILMIITLPVSCLMGSLALSGLMFSQLGTLIFGVILMWWLFPLIFSAHGYLLYHEKLWQSILRSIRLTRLTFPITGTFILVAVMLSEGLDSLWNTPADGSWLMLLGLVGHAFINTALLAASFVYFHEMNRWLQTMSGGVRLNSPDRT